MGKEQVALYRTYDGGKSWFFVSSTNTHIPRKHSSSIPWDGLKTGIGFRDASTGWITGLTLQNGFPWVYVTHDGGKTWLHQDLPIPKKVAGAQFKFIPPTFFTNQYGIMLAQIQILRGHNIVFVTDDGGITWRCYGLTGKLRDLGWVFNEQLDGAGFILRNGTVSYGNHTFITNDGGYTWKSLQTVK